MVAVSWSNVFGWVVLKDDSWSDVLAEWCPRKGETQRVRRIGVPAELCAARLPNALMSWEFIVSRPRLFYIRIFFLSVPFSPLFGKQKIYISNL